GQYAGFSDPNLGTDVADAEPSSGAWHRPFLFPAGDGSLLAGPAQGHLPAQHRAELLGRDRVARPVRVRLARRPSLFARLARLAGARARLAALRPGLHPGAAGHALAWPGRRPLLQERPEPGDLGASWHALAGRSSEWAAKTSGRS